MLNIRVLASGSKGNCYLLDDGESPLLIEAGIPIAKIREGTTFMVSTLAGCLISHAHMDHCKAAHNLMRMGVPCYMSKGTAAAIDAESHCARIVEPNQLFNVGPWVVRAIEVHHDCEGSLGFLICRSGETVLFLTDTAYTQYKFTGINYLMIECNFDDDLIRQNVVSGVVPQAVKRRVYGSHMSLQRVLEFLKANDLSGLQEIWLLHLSDANSDAIAFRNVVAESTGVPVYIA
jgi:phosphoribosyl 1,2-cyclic phosphodiesterase